MCYRRFTFPPVGCHGPAAHLTPKIEFARSADFLNGGRVCFIRETRTARSHSSGRFDMWAENAVRW